MLGHLELDIEVSDASMETTESNNYRGVSKKDRDVNGMLAAMQEGVRFFCKVMSDKPVVFKDQRAERIKQSDIVRHGSHLKMKVCGVGLDMHRV